MHKSLRWAAFIVVLALDAWASAYILDRDRKEFGLLFAMGEYVLCYVGSWLMLRPLWPLQKRLR